MLLHVNRLRRNLLGERFNTVLVIMQSYARDHEEDERQDITTYKAYFETSSSLSMF